MNKQKKIEEIIDEVKDEMTHGTRKLKPEFRDFRDVIQNIKELAEKVEDNQVRKRLEKAQNEIPEQFKVAHRELQKAKEGI